MTRSSLPLFVAAAALLAARAQSAWPQSPARTEIVSIRGYVQRQSAGFGSRHRLALVPQALAEGQSLSCGDSSGATVRFKDRSSIELGPGSVFYLRDDKADLTSALLNLGGLVADVAHIPERRFEISTPAAVVRAVGTRFSVEARSPEETLITVGAGKVSVQGRWNGEPIGDVVFLTAGHSVDVVRGEINALSGGPRDLLNPELERQLDDEVDQMFDESPAPLQETAPTR